MGLTTDPNDPRLRQVGERGLNAAYLVLSEEERAKGFVRPVRRGYMHVGKALCGELNEDLLRRVASGESSMEVPDDVVAFVCALLPGHDGECFGVSQQVTQEQLDQLRQEGKIGGCGTVTWMVDALAETYARDPSFYGATYCGHCRQHLPVGAHGEFVWCDEHGEPLPLWVGT